MLDWAPSQKTLLLLKQMGVPRQSITACQHSFSQSRPVVANDTLFIKFVLGSQELDDKHYATVKNIAKLPLLWRESRATEHQLLSQGFEKKLIDDYRDLFVIQNREQGALLTNADYCFLLFCQNRPMTLARQITPNWLPSESLLCSLVEQGGSLAAIKQYVHYFRLRWREAGAEKRDWERVFQQEFIQSSGLAPQ